MEFKHRNRLFSTYVNLHKQIQDIRNVICEGNAPTGTSRPLPPLPPSEQAVILGTLEQVLEQCEQLVQRYAPDELARWRRSQSPGATRMWLSIILRQMSDQLRELHPERLERRFGKLAPSERKVLQTSVEAMLKLLETLEAST